MGKKPAKRQKRKQSVNLLMDKPTYQGNNNIPTRVELTTYNPSRIEIKDISHAPHLKKEISANFVNWISITGISDANEITKICTEFGLHGFDIKDLLSEQQVTKVVAYDKITFVLMPTFYFRDEDTLEEMRVAFILGENFVISMEEADVPLFDEINDAIKENWVSLRDRPADYLLYILMSAVNTLSSYSVMKMEDQLIDIEDKLLEHDNSVDIMHYLRYRRLDYTRMKRSVLSLREEYTNLLRNTNHLIKDENIVYFNNYDDKLRTLLSNMDAFHDSLSSLLDTYYNNVNLKMNEIIKRLTVVSTIFIPLTFLVGVWGMNFKYMPELEWKYGYLLSWSILVIVVVIASVLLKKKRWF